MNQSRTKGNDSDFFFLFFPSTLGRARHGAKKEGDFTKEKHHPVWLWWKKERSNCIVFRGSDDVYRKRVFLWITAMGKTADLIKSTPHVDVTSLWEKGTLTTTGFLGFSSSIQQRLDSLQCIKYSSQPPCPPGKKEDDSSLRQTLIPN